jgi:phage shock protein PspC (stress-responsive transcriptional regulator)
LFSEKLKAGTSVFISEQAVAGIIASIGRPEEFDGDNIELGSTSYSSTTSNQEKSSFKQKSSSASGNGFESRGSLYRNENDKVLGGVCSGLGVDLRIDTTIIRIIIIPTCCSRAFFST